jgi:hypothetical protein
MRSPSGRYEDAIIRVGPWVGWPAAVDRARRLRGRRPACGGRSVARRLPARWPFVPHKGRAGTLPPEPTCAALRGDTSPREGDVTTRTTDRLACERSSGCDDLDGAPRRQRCRPPATRHAPASRSVPRVNWAMPVARTGLWPSPRQMTGVALPCRLSRQRVESAGGEPAEFLGIKDECREGAAWSTSRLPYLLACLLDIHRLACGISLWC